MPGAIVLIHGAFEGAWCFNAFAEVLRQRGFDCRAPNLRYHGAPGAADPALAGTSIADYTRDMAEYVRALPATPVLIGHSMGGLIAQQLAAAGLARALVLLASAAPWGVLPSSEWERKIGTGLMSTGPFWTRSLQSNFDVAKTDALASLPAADQRAVFDRLGSESGRALFEMFFWMFDDHTTTRVNAAAVECPVLVLAGSEDRVIASATARRIAGLYAERATFRELPGRGHFLPLEPGWEALAAGCADWIGKA